KDPSSRVDAAKLKVLAGKLITPAIRYSQPELQTQITYLYGMTSRADQQIGQDAINRYRVLKKMLDGLQAEADAILGGR
ncbi:MAG: hypothetical protein ACRD1F_07605, partial [Terriglobales bacterium]